MAAKFFTCRLRKASSAASSLGPSRPQFHDMLSSFPSRLSSPLASLCLPLYDTMSLSVKPSWQVMKFTLLVGARPDAW